MSAFAILFLCLLLIGLILLWLGRRVRVRAGLPVGEVIATDTSGWRALDQPLLSRRFGLVGKPDYLVEVTEARRKIMIPVEVKSRPRPQTVYDSHVLQLATYCLLVEDVYKQPPPYGYIRYADATFKIPFTVELRQQALTAADAVRGARRARSIPRQHNDPGRCAGCGYRHACGEQALL